MYDYLDLTSGSDPHTQGKVCKFSILGCPDTDANIVDQLESAGLSWASYAEDYPTPGKCSLKDGVRRVGSVDTVYTSGHVPYLHYTDIRTNPARCTHFFGNPSGLSKSGLPIGGEAGLLRLTAIQPATRSQRSPSSPRINTATCTRAAHRVFVLPVPPTRRRWATSFSRTGSRI